MDNLVICVARGFGSGGKQLSMLLSETLGIPCYEHRILTLASRYSGIEENRFTEVDEKLRGGLFVNTLKNLPLSLNPRPERDFESDTRLFSYQTDIIKKLADTESCIIVGKCADWVLKDHKNVVRLFIDAPIDYCIDRIMEKMDVTSDEARKIIERTDKYRSDYYKFYTGKNWNDPKNYDLCLNPAQIGHENCLTVIMNYLSMKFGDGYLRDVALTSREKHGTFHYFR